MSERLDDLPDRLSRDLAEVRWPEPAEIRARAQRRSIRTVAAAPVAALVTLSVGIVAAFTGGWPMPARVLSTTSPSLAVTPAAITARPTETDQVLILAEAVLLPDDVGRDLIVRNEIRSRSGPPSYWAFDMTPCPAYAGMGIEAYRGYEYMYFYHISTDPTAGLMEGDTLFVQAMRYPGEVASTVVGDIRRAILACRSYEVEGSEASSPAAPAHGLFTWALLDEGFTGDQSLLVRERVDSVSDVTGDLVGQPIVEVFAVVRVNDLVAVISRYSTDEAEIATLSEVAATRMCLAATPRC